MKNIGIILAGGIGERFNSSIPKQYAKINGKYCIHYVIEEFIKAELFDRIIIVLSDMKYKYVVEKFLSDSVEVISGGETRNKSILNAILHIKELIKIQGLEDTFETSSVLFHDAARPLIQASDLKQFLDGLQEFDGVVVGEKITDSLYPTINRSGYRLVQTPEAFKFEVLDWMFNVNREDYTAIYQHFPIERIKLIELGHYNIKVTYPHDVLMLESLITFFPVCKDYDPQEFKNKRVLVFGGSGGIGSCLVKKLHDLGSVVDCPCSFSVNLENFNESTFFHDEVLDYDFVFNCSGAYANDDAGVVSNYEKIMTVNFKANLQIMDFLIKKNKKPVSVVLLSSSAASFGRQNLTVYSASKAAVQSMVESQATKLNELGIKLNCISPEKVNTPLLEKLHGKDFEIRDVLSPAEVVTVMLSVACSTNFGKIISLRVGV